MKHKVDGSHIPTLHQHFYIVVERGWRIPAISCFTIMYNKLSYPFLTSLSNSETSRFATLARWCTAAILRDNHSYSTMIS